MMGGSKCMANCLYTTVGLRRNLHDSTRLFFLGTLAEESEQSEFNPFVHGLGVGGRGRPRSRKGARVSYDVLKMDSRCGAARSESSPHLCGNQNFADVANFA